MRLQQILVLLAAATGVCTADGSSNAAIRAVKTPSAASVASACVFPPLALHQPEPKLTSWQCDALAAAGFGNRVTYPGAQAYEDRISSYWSVTAHLRPRCLLQPADAGEVSQMVRALVEANGTTEHGCHFAVRSGGHTTWPGAASIEDGVTVDLGLMNATTYFPGNASAGVQPGAGWASVYRALEEHGVTVAGGRSSTVGVGGFVLGGGISFWSAREGLVCDNVENFEVVLASGDIINANRDAHADLFQALKGGSNNFGIVTRIDLPAFEQKELWGGIVAYPLSTAPQHMKALVDLIDRFDDDHNAAVIVMLQYTSAIGHVFVANTYEYTQPVERPPIFDNFLAVPGNFSDSMRFTYVRGLTEELENALGSSIAFTTVTFQNDERVLAKATELFEWFVEKLQPDGGEWFAAGLFQPLPAAFTKHSLRKGGNVLGLERFKENNILFLGYLSWKDHGKAPMFQAAAEQLVRDIEDFARSIGKGNPFKYLNYAHADQDPLSSYGAESIRKMRAAAAKYDPHGVFQHMVPGGFKISKVREEKSEVESGHDEL